VLVLKNKYKMVSIKKILLSLMLGVMLIGNVFSFSAELLNTNPAPIVAGEYADVTVRFSNDNTDGVKNDVSFGFEDSKYFSLIEGPRDFISKVYQGEYFTKTFRVFFSEDLEQGFIALPFFVNSDGLKQIFDLSVMISGSSVKPNFYIGSVKSTPNELLPDTDNNMLKVVLQNLGDREAQLVSAELVIESDLVTEGYAYSLTDSVSSIDGGTENKFEFSVDLDKEVRGVIPAKLVLNYRYEKAIGSEFEIVSEELPLKIRVSSSPVLEIGSVELVDDFKIGSIDNRVRVEVKNVGDEDAKDVRVRLSPDISYPFVYNQLTEYVTSNIKVGDSYFVEFKVEVLKRADARDYGVTVVIESLVGDSRYSNEGTVDLTVTAGSETTIPDIGKILIVIILLVSAWIGFNTFRSRKK
jgi:hypothetical protein